MPAKLEAIRAYDSQFIANNSPVVQMLTHLNGYFGGRIGVEYAEPFFTARHSTGWGPAVNLEGKEGDFVRSFLINNALMWLRDYGFDGLRLDAVHALKDESRRHFLVELAETVRSQFVGRRFVGGAGHLLAAGSRQWGYYHHVRLGFRSG